ncbi:MAG: hypothetical protein H6742_13530 [Alphaproteobacteria bacterium]|nr:hypothetical protein [Alphaproteobacteria bacterium]
MPLLALLLLACGTPASDTGAASDTDGSDTDASDTDTDASDTDTDLSDGGADSGSALLELSLDPDCSPFNVGGDCLTPWPSTFHMAPDGASETGLRLDYSVEMLASPDGPLPVDPGMFNRYDGISVTSPLLVLLGRDVDDAFLFGLEDAGASLAADADVVLMDSETGARVPLMVELDMNNRDDADYTGRHALILRPVAPMTPGRRYVAALTTDLRDVDGAAFDVSPAFQALVEGARTTDRRLEAARDRYDDVLFPTLEAAGYPRQDLLVAFEVQVASDAQSLGPILSMKEAAAAALAEASPAYTLDSVQVDPDDDVALIVQGTFRPPSFLDDNELRYADDAYSVELSPDEWPAYPFTMVVPKGLPEGEPVPLVVMGHGIFGSGSSWLTGGGVGQITQAMAAQAGVVLIATDWIGLSSGDLSLIIAEVVPDLGRVRIVTDRLAQSLINTQALVALARDELQYLPETGRTVDAPLFDDRLFYYGVSLGGIQGTSFVALTDEIDRAVFSVPGAGWTHMIQRSWHFGEIETLLDLLYPDPLSQLVFVTALQSDFDASDPVNLGRVLAEREDFVGVMQEAVGDCQVPNLATDVLVRTVGAHHLEAAPRPIEGVALVSGEQTDGISLTQIVLPDALAAFTPLDQNTIPTDNNNTHSDIVSTDQALGQTLELVERAVAVHPCDGACDPD